MALNLQSELKRFKACCTWSLAGWRAAWASEKSLRQWALVAALSTVLAMVLDLTGAERALILALGLLILAAELMNTAIEEAVDYISKDTDPRAKIIKDCGSAAVALTAIAGGVAWLAILVG